MSASLRLAADGNTRPPRLQPSPSLPNLRARNLSSDPQSARPQPTAHNSSSPISPFSPANAPSNVSMKDGDLHQSRRSRQQSKNHHYLTPPLTPASSLKSDGTDPDSADLNPLSDGQPPPQNILSSDCTESRFLIIGNVPNGLSEDIIGPYFHSLAALRDDPSPVQKTSQSVPSTGNVIQTIYYRFQEKRAIILAFYDIRDAERVKRIIEANDSRSPFGSDVDDEKRTSCESMVGSPWVDALTCLFVAPDHFVQLLGQSASAALTRTEGAFCVSVGGMMAERDHNYSGWSRVRFFVPVKLKSVLAKYGELESFRLLKEDEEKYRQVLTLSFGCRSGCLPRRRQSSRSVSLSGSFASDYSVHSQLFMVQYYDVRAGDLAWENLNGRIVDSMKLQLIERDVLRGGCSEPRDLEEDTVSSEGHLGGGHAAEPKTPRASTYLSQSQTITTPSGIPFPLLNDVGARDCPSPCEHEGTVIDLAASSVINNHNSSILDRQKPTPRYSVDTIEPPANEAFSVDHPHGQTGTFPVDQFGRRGSNNLFFDAVRSRAHHKVADADYMRTANMNTIAVDRSQVCPSEAAQAASGTTDLCHSSCPGAQPHFAHDYFTHTDRYLGDASMQPSWVSSPHAHGVQYPVSSQSPMQHMCPSICWDASTSTWVAWGSPGILPEQWSAFSPSPGYYHGTTSQGVPYSYPPHASPSLVHHPYGTTPNRAYPPTYSASPRTPPENNQLDTRKIEQGLDTRTTVMIKNIPNKMTDKELIAYINKICPRRIDFLYLRMDFQNGCNVGYAFVNFIAVEDLLRFAKMTLGEKWNMYSSEKVLQMSYANYQGKEALVEKFKNSCIMDEREEWRPKIFYSDPGPNQGLPEEFPKPTHLRRKERSSYNRGALFVPGINGGTGYPRTFLNATSPHQRTSRSSPCDERQRKVNYPASESIVLK